MTAFTHILNRLNPSAIVDGWMHVCPLGEHPWTSEDGKETIIQVIDPEACQLMAQSYPLSTQDSMVDWEHDSVRPKGKTKAAGWGKEAQVRKDGLWVRVDWTPTGKADVQGKEYKFNSPCFPRPGLVPLGGNRFRVTQVSRIALTNNPNLRGQEPLTNAKPNDNPPPTPTMDYKALLLKILGLPATATDDQISAACGKGQDMPAMNSRITELETLFANTTLDALGIKDAAQRKLFTPLLNSVDKETREGAMKTLEALKSKAAPPVAIHNTRNPATPKVDSLSNANASGEGDEDENTDAERQAADAIAGRADELLRNSAGSRRWKDCFIQAQSEHRARAAAK